jgi:hypothetical protein
MGGPISLPDGDPSLNTGITQYASNIASVSNSGSIQALGEMTQGSSASMTATGAVASIGISANNADLNPYIIHTIIQGIGQVASNGAGAITNTGSITAGNLNSGAAVSVGATGAVASLTYLSLMVAWLD